MDFFAIFGLQVLGCFRQNCSHSAAVFGSAYLSPQTAHSNAVFLFNPIFFGIFNAMRIQSCKLCLLFHLKPICQIFQICLNGGPKTRPRGSKPGLRPRPTPITASKMRMPAKGSIFSAKLFPIVSPSKNRKAGVHYFLHCNVNANQYENPKTVFNPGTVFFVY